MLWNLLHFSMRWLSSWSKWIIFIILWVPPSLSSPLLHFWILLSSDIFFLASILWVYMPSHWCFLLELGLKVYFFLDHFEIWNFLFKLMNCCILMLRRRVIWFLYWLISIRKLSLSVVIEASWWRGFVNFTAVRWLSWFVCTVRVLIGCFHVLQVFP